MTQTPRATRALDKDRARLPRRRTLQHTRPSQRGEMAGSKVQVAAQIAGMPRLSSSNRVQTPLPSLGTLLFAILLLVACGGGAPIDQGLEPTQPPSDVSGEGGLAERLAPTKTAASLSLVDLTMTEQDVGLAPLPVRAGVPFTITAVLHNNSGSPAVDIPLMIHISAVQENLGFQPFFQVLTVTVPSTEPLAVNVPVSWNLEGGEHQLWLQLNRMPGVWQSQTPVQPEKDISDNIVLLDLFVEPFYAYVSDTCPGRVDVEITSADLFAGPDGNQVLVRVHNLGNCAVYNLPVVVLGEQLSGIAYTPVIPPCGGTSQVIVALDRALGPGDSLTVLVNPEEWEAGLVEDEQDNNVVDIASVPESGLEPPPVTELADYDFLVSADDIGIPELWFVQVTVHNLGTRDADMVPIRIENEAGRRLTDSIPLVRGEGLGTAVIRVSYLWTHGGTLTFTVNPSDASGAYVEANRDNNVATFVLP